MEKHPECITQEEVKLWLASGTDVVLIDVRDRNEYENKHVPHAFHIPLSHLTQEIEALRQKTKYITICGKGGGRSAEGAQILKKAGLEAWWLCGGTLGWED